MNEALHVHPDIKWARPTVDPKDGFRTSSFGLVEINDGRTQTRLNSEGRLTERPAGYIKKPYITFGKLDQEGFRVTPVDGDIVSLLQDPTKVAQIIDASVKLLEGIWSDEAASASNRASSDETDSVWRRTEPWWELESIPPMVGPLQQARELVEKARTIVATAREDCLKQTSDAADALHELGVESVAGYINNKGDFPSFITYKVADYLPQPAATE